MDSASDQSDTFEVRHLTCAEIMALQPTTRYESEEESQSISTPSPLTDPEEPSAAQPRTFTPDAKDLTQSCFTSSWVPESEVSLDPLSDEEYEQLELEPSAKRRRLDEAIELRDVREAADLEADRPVMRELSNLEWLSGQERFEHIAVGKRALVTQIETTVDNRSYLYLFVLRKLEDGWARLVHKVLRTDKHQYFDIAWTQCSACLDGEPNQLAHTGPGGCCAFE